MRILIVEDVAPIANRLLRLTKEALKNDPIEVVLAHSLTSASVILESQPFDLLLLDLNLQGKDGFKLLQQVVSEPFHTIIVSAYADKAITAFEYGVIDFVAKPFTEERLALALHRFQCIYEKGDSYHPEKPLLKDLKTTNYLSIRESDSTQLISTSQISHVNGAGNYTEIHLENGETFIHSKSIGNIEAILPDSFVRPHKSHIVREDLITKISVIGDHKYAITLSNGHTIPISRNWYKLQRGKSDIR